VDSTSLKARTGEVGRENNEHPLCTLPREDLDLIASLVLQSGSLKGLAEIYRVSYPTIRARLDRTISRVKLAMEGVEPDAFTNALADLVQAGELSVSGARRLRDVARHMNSKPDESN